MPRVERGFRRLTLVLSIAILCVSLLPTPYLAYTLWLANGYDECSKKILDRWQAEESEERVLPRSSGLAIPEGVHPGFKSDESKSFGLADPEFRLKYHETVCGKNPVSEMEGTVTTAVGVGLLVVRGLAFVGVPPGEWWQTSPFIISAYFLVNLIVSLTLAAIPWGVFYLVRWIARGFRG